MRKRILLLLIVLISIGLAANAHITFRDSIYSNILQEYRIFEIALPPSYDDDINNKNYPAIIVLDGERLFNISAVTAEYLSQGLYPQMPESIVIGIHQKVRNYELTPYTSAKYDTSFRPNGGADKFYQFLTEELTPYIDSKYKSNSHKGIIGHSLGGLFTSYLMIKGDTFFSHKIAIDPSLWWNTGYYTEQFKNIPQSYLTNNHYYLASSFIEEHNRGHLLSHKNNIDNSNNFLQSLQLDLSHYCYQYFPKEDHGLIAPPAIWYALRWMYPGYNFETKKAFSDINSIKKHYSALSKQYGYTIYPDKSFLIRLKKMLEKRNLIDQIPILDEYIYSY